jgi:hypothetical protein
MTIAGQPWIAFKVTLAPQAQDVLVTASSSNATALDFNPGSSQSKWVWAGDTQVTFFLKPHPVQTPTTVTLTAVANGKSLSMNCPIKPH